MKKALLLFVFFITIPLYANKEWVHQWLDMQAWEFLRTKINDVNITPLYDSFFRDSNGNYYEYGKEPNNFSTCLTIGGSWAEDHTDILYSNHGFVGEQISATHFWNADNANPYAQCSLEGLAGTYQNAFEKAETLWNGNVVLNMESNWNFTIYDKERQVLEQEGISTSQTFQSMLIKYNGLPSLITTQSYKFVGVITTAGNLINFSKEYTIYQSTGHFHIFFAANILGRISHLIGDMSVPGHVLVKSHPCLLGNEDYYEQMIAGSESHGVNCDDKPSSFYRAQNYSYTQALQQGGFINSLHCNNVIKYLMYTTNEITDCYRMNRHGVMFNGDKNYMQTDNLTGDNYSNDISSIINSIPTSFSDYNSEMNNMASNSFVFAIRAIASLFLRFGKETNLLKITPFTVNVTRVFEFDQNEILPPQNSDGYSLSISTPNTYAINGKQYIFVSWSDGEIANPRIVNSNLSVSAIYKVTHKSNSATAFSNNSQRKLVRTKDSWLHQVYESMGHVWIEHSTDNGTTWFLGNNRQPLDKGEGKCPSIDWHYNTSDPNNADYNSVVAAYQQKAGIYYTIEYAIFKYSNGSYVRQGQDFSGPLYTEPSGGDQYASVNANPNIAWDGYGGISYFALTFERKSTAGSMQPGIYWKYGFMYEGGVSSIPAPPTAPIKITGTNSSSINASVFLNKLSTENSLFDIVYQQGTDNIFDVQLSCNLNGSTWSTSQLTTTISRGSGFKNYQPTMVHMKDNNIRVCWIRDLYGGGSSAPYYVNAVYWNSTSPNVFTYAGNMVNSISLNLRDDNANSYYAYAQNTNNSNWQNFASNGTTTTTLSTTGRYIQLSNGASSAVMYASAFYPVSLPYYFLTSGSLGSLAKSSDGENTYGRGVVLGTDQFGFSYSMKSLKAGKNSIKFVDIPESKAKKAKRTGVEQLGLDSLNTFLLSEPFTIEEGMTISFSEGAGFNAPGEGAEVSASLLADKDYLIDRKIELIEESTGKSIAVIKQSQYTPQDKNTLDLKAADVTITGKEARKVRLKITLEANIKGIEGMLVNEYNTINENMLSKLSAEKITLREKGEIASYVLEQNYPNPFNPKTTISYQLPKDGHVTLKVYDILGKEIASLVSEYKSQGRYSVEFDASNLSSGTYIYELRVNDYTSVKKLLLLK